MSGGDVLVRAIDLHDDEEMPRFIAFQEAHGTPRHDLAGLRAILATDHAHLLLVAEDERDQLVGCAWAGRRTSEADEPLGSNLFALPGRTDVLEALLARITAWTGAEGAPVLYEFLSGPTAASRADREAIGFRFGNDRYRVRRELTPADAAEVPAPAGCAFTSLAERPELAPEFCDLWNEAGNDIPTALAWQDVDVDGLRLQLGLEPGDAWPDSIRLLVESASDRIVAFVALLEAPGSNGARFGHRLTAVRRDRRGRGYARAVKRDAIRWAATNGADELMASNDSENVAMRAINEQLGFEAVHTVAVYEMPLHD